MRATALMFAAALLVLAQPLAAQEAGDGAGPAKEKHGAPAMRGRVGSVSPDEARRAERARKRAAAAHKPARTEAAKSEPAKSAPAKPEGAKPAPVKTASPPPAAPREAAAPNREGKPAPVKEAARPREREDAEPAHPAPHHARASRKHRIAERARRDRRARDRYVADRPVRSRRIYVGMPPRWTPQVGSTVPRGVRLYPLPPGYYAPGPAYVYGASEGQPRWSYGPRPVYGAPYQPAPEEPDSSPEIE